jgi:hypothetical protein
MQVRLTLLPYQLHSLWRMIFRSHFTTRAPGLRHFTTRKNHFTAPEREVIGGDEYASAELVARCLVGCSPEALPHVLTALSERLERKGVSLLQLLREGEMCREWGGQVMSRTDFCDALGVGGWACTN